MAYTRYPAASSALTGKAAIGLDADRRIGRSLDMAALPPVAVDCQILDADMPTMTVVAHHRGLIRGLHPPPPLVARKSTA